MKCDNPRCKEGDKIIVRKEDSYDFYCNNRRINKSGI